MSYYHAFASFATKEKLNTGDDVRICKNVKIFASPQIAEIERRPVYAKIGVTNRTISVQDSTYTKRFRYLHDTIAPTKYPEKR